MVEWLTYMYMYGRAELVEAATGGSVVVRITVHTVNARHMLTLKLTRLGCVYSPFSLTSLNHYFTIFTLQVYLCK